MTATAQRVSGVEPAIRTPDQRLRVFVSSTIGELAPEREAVKTAIRTLRLSPVLFELGARPHPPRRLYRSYLAQSHVFIGVYWQSYGWVAPGEEISGIEDEYRLAGDRPALIYVKEPAPERDPRLAAMLERIRNDDRVSYRFFESPGELAELVVEDLAILMSERFEVDRPLPSGTLTFLTTDIAGSERIAEERSDEYVELVATYRSALARLIDEGNGYFVDAERDTTLSVFADATDAARTALAARRAMSARLGLDLRIGLHTGTTQPRGGIYAGIEVHRASRVGTAAERGQILMTRSTAQLLESGEDWTVRDLGMFSLAGLTRSEHLFMLVPPEERAVEHPHPRARRAGVTRLPAQITSLVGRGADISAISRMLADPAIRLVTLTGPGGIGKTRLAVAVAAEVTAQYPDGVFYVDLAAVDSPKSVLAAVAEAAGVAPEGDILDTLAETMAHRRALIVVDNFEQVVAAGPDLTALLSRAPGLNALVTSRVVLRVGGEHEYPVEPLGLPAAGAGPAEIAAAEAVALFVDRAAAIRPGFELTVDNAAAVASISRRLEGVPLAIEIAAARLRMLSPAALADRLMQSLDDIGEGPADLPDRQRTLRATIGWSHGLLSEPEQRVFRRLGAFSGGWTLDAAVAVAACDESDVATVLGSLVDKSLVRPEPGDEPRFRMLVTVREYSREQLAGSGEMDSIRDRHAAFYRDLALAALDELSGPLQAATVARLSMEWANMEAAAARMTETADFDSLVSMLHGAWVFLWLAGHLARAEEWLNLAGQTGVALTPIQRGRAEWMAGSIAFETGRYHEGRELVEASLEKLRGTDDRRTLAWAEFMCALLQPAFGVPTEETREAIAEAIDAFVSADDQWGEGYGLITLGILAASEGDIEEATAYHRRTLDLARQFRNDNLIGQAFTQLGVTALAGGEMAAAGRHLAEAGRVFAARGYREGIAYVYEGAAALHLQTGDTQAGMLAMGAAEEIRRRLQLHPWPATAWFSQMLTVTADSIDDPDLQAWRRLGRESDPFDLMDRILPTPHDGAAE